MEYIHTPLDTSYECETQCRVNDLLACDSQKTRRRNVITRWIHEVTSNISDWNTDGIWPLQTGSFENT